MEIVNEFSEYIREVEGAYVMGLRRCLFFLMSMIFLGASGAWANDTAGFLPGSGSAMSLPT